MADVTVRVRNVVENSGEVQKQAQHLGGLKSAAISAAAGYLTLQGAIQGAKKLFEFGQEGAQISQLEESFTRLNDRVLHTPSLLEDMRRATRGTISDVQLMQGVMTLTAGASGDFAQELAGATPRLLEIAKAASTLNPLLGDTSYLYQSLATGIKRGTPLLIDNTGLVVKVGEANEKMAQSLGKTVEELSAQEKQMALLNATLEAGDTLIEQVGGNVDSQADAYARLTVHMTEAGEAFKVGFADGLLAADWDEANEGVAALADNMERMGSMAGNTLNALNEIGKWTPPAIVARLLGMAADPFQEGGIFSGPLQGPFAVSEEVSEQHRSNARAADDYSESLDRLRRGEMQEVEQARELTETHREVVRQFEDGERAADDFSRRLSQLSQGTGVRRISGDLRDFNRITQQGTMIQNAFRDALQGTDSALRRMGGELARAEAAMSSAIRVNMRAERTLTGVAGAAAGAAPRVESFWEGVREASLEAEQAMQDAEQQAEQYWATIGNITSGALGSQFDLIDNIGDTRDEIARLRDEVEANPDDVGLVNELERAIDRFHELTGQASESWEDMVLDIITETGGFDQVAADFAVAAGIMTQAQADAQLGAVQMAEALQNIGLAIDAGTISPDQGAELFSTLMGGMDDAGSAIEETQALLDSFTGGGVDLGASGEGSIPPQIIGAIEGSNTLNASLMAISDNEYFVTVDDSQVTTAIDRVSELQGALLSVGGTTTTVNIPPIVGGGIGHAQGTGGWLTVPPGFPNDTYPAFLSSGETYNVMPAGQSPQGGGGQHIDARTYIVANTRETMALAMASAGEARRRRGDSYMGRR